MQNTPPGPHNSEDRPPGSRGRGYTGIHSRSGELQLHRLGIRLRYESTIERDFLLLLDASPDVISVRRSDPIQVHSPSGLVTTYTPDYDVKLSGGVQTFEVKPEQLIATEIHGRKADWLRRSEILQELGRPLHLILDRDLPPERISVASACLPFHDVEPCPEIQQVIRKELKARASVPYGFLRQIIRGAPGINATLFEHADPTLRGMIARSELILDLGIGQEVTAGIVMLPTPRNLPSAPVGRLMTGILEAPPPVTSSREDTVSQIPEEQRFLASAVGRRYQALFQLYSDPSQPLTDGRIQELKEATGFSRNTLFLFRKALLAAGAPGIALHDLLPHLAAFARTHAPTRTVPPGVAQLIEEHAGRFYFQKVGSRGRATTIADLHLGIHKACEAAGLPRPAFTTVQRHLERIRATDPIRAARARDGEDAAHQLTGRMRHLTVSRYGELWAVDCTPADAFINGRDDAGDNHRFRPRIVTVVDVATGQVLRSTLFPHGVGANDILSVLQGLFIGRADEFRRAGVKHIPQARGLPVALRMDSGTEFANQHVTRVLNDLGIQVIRRNKGLRHHGGNEERTIGTLVRAHHGLPGTTMNSIRARAGYDAKAKAEIDLDSFSSYHALVVEQFNLRPRPLETASRQDHAAALITQGRSDLRPPSASQLDYIQTRMFVEFHRRVERAGVSFLGLKYRADALAPLAVRREKVIVSYDPGDVRTVNVIDPRTGEIIRAATRFPQSFLELLNGRDEPVPSSVWDTYRKQAQAFAQDVRHRLPSTRELQQEVLAEAARKRRTPRRDLTVQKPGRQPTTPSTTTLVPADIEFEEIELDMEV